MDTLSPADVTAFNQAVDVATPVNVLARLVHHRSSLVRSTALINVSTPVSVCLDRVACETNEEVLTRLAVWTSDSQVLDALLETDFDVSATVAGNDALTLGLMRVLVCDSDPVVRLALASNERTEGVILSQLCEDVDDEVVYAAAGNPNLTFELMEQLLVHPCDQVRVAFVERDDVPSFLLECLADDSDLVIADAVEQIRVERLYDAVEKLTGLSRATALLLIPSFSGWDWQLLETVTSLAVKPQVSVFVR